MRTLFDQLLLEGEAGIDRLVTERQQENVSLDFKEKRVALRGSLDQEDRKTLAKALSAFANSAGGLLVYGVEARKGDDGVDCAREAKPIAEVERFLSEAVTATGQLIQPRHDGIEVRAIHSVRQPGAGYLLFLVARSERRPHRSEAAGQKQYFKRAGDSSFEMEHYDIEDAFRRFTTPVLQVGVRFSSGAMDGLHRPVAGHIEVYFENTSLVTAKMPYVQLRDIRGARPTIGPPPGLIMHYEGGWTSFSGEPSVVVHPGISRLMAAFDVRLQWDLPTDVTIEGTAASWWSFTAQCRFGCEDLLVSEVMLEFTHRDLYLAMQR